MQAMISLVDGDPRELYALFAWLQRDDTLRGRVSTVPRPQQPEEMGQLADVLTIAVGGSGVATALVATLSTWLSMRRARISVETTMGNRTRRVEVDGRDEATAGRLLRTALDADAESVTP